MRRTRRDPGDITAIFVHAGAGFHSYQNEKAHLKACSDAATVAMTLLKNGSPATDAVEMAIKVLEDREITNSGFGSNLAMDGAVECDATIVDHYGRSGACGAVSQIKNPVSLARVILDCSTKPMALQRVPPNLLVGQGATDFAYEQNFPILPHDYLISRGARERWLKWKRDLEFAENKLIEQRSEDIDMEYEQIRRRVLEDPEVSEALVDASPANITISSPLPEPTFPIDFTAIQPPMQPLAASTADIPEPQHEPNASPLMDMSDNFERPIPLSEYFERPTVTAKDFANMRAYVHSPLSRVVQQDGSSRQTFDTPANTPVDGDGNTTEEDGEIHSDGEVFSDGGVGVTQSSEVFQRRLMSRHDGSDDLDSLPKPKSPFEISMAPDFSSESPESIQISHSESSLDTADMHNTAPFTGVPIALPKIVIHGPATPEIMVDSMKRDDMITDTVGAVAVDCYGNIAAGSSSGGIGMKHRGRTGPAALVGVGTAVVPMDPDDPERTSVAVVTSGTGEHMATTMAAATAADRIYHSYRKRKGGGMEGCTEDEAIQAMIDIEFMHHPGVRNSHCAGAIGIMAVKKTTQGVYLYFAHNTDSFAIASMSGEDKKPACTMSRVDLPGMITTGGRAAKWKGRH